MSAAVRPHSLDRSQRWHLHHHGRGESVEDLDRNDVGPGIRFGDPEPLVGPGLELHLVPRGQPGHGVRRARCWSGGDAAGPAPPAVRSRTVRSSDFCEPGERTQLSLHGPAPRPSPRGPGGIRGPSGTVGIGSAAGKAASTWCRAFSNAGCDLELAAGVGVRTVPGVLQVVVPGGGGRDQHPLGAACRGRRPGHRSRCSAPEQFGWVCGRGSWPRTTSMPGWAARASSTKSSSRAPTWEGDVPALRSLSPSIASTTSGWYVDTRVPIGDLEVGELHPPPGGVDLVEAGIDVGVRPP